MCQSYDTVICQVFAATHVYESQLVIGYRTTSCVFVFYVRGKVVGKRCLRGLRLRRGSDIPTGKSLWLSDGIPSQSTLADVSGSKLSFLSKVLPNGIC